MKKLMMAGVVLAMMVGMAQAATVVNWTGGTDNNWQNAANWSTSPSLPVEDFTTSDIRIINDTENYALYTSAEGTKTYYRVSVGYGNNGRLDITGGKLIHDSTTEHRVGVGGKTGTLNISGNGWFAGGNTAQIGLDNSSHGYVNVSDSGIYQITRGLTKDSIANVGIHLGAGAGGAGVLTVSDSANVYTRFGVLLGLAAGTGSGTYHVNGGSSYSLIGGNNGANSSNDGFWRQRANGTLQATVDASGNLGTIEIYDAGSGGSYVTFDSGALLDVGFAGSNLTGSWDLMTFRDGGVTDNGLQFAPGVDTDVWSFAFVDSDASGQVDTLRLTAIPEPATIGMIGMVGVGLIAVRRFRM